MNLLQQLIIYVRASRRYGQTYVRNWVRSEVPVCFIAHLGVRSVRIHFTKWGRSRNKFKAYANFVDSGKPVPTKYLHLIQEFTR